MPLSHPRLQKTSYSDPSIYYRNYPIVEYFKLYTELELELKIKEILISTQKEKLKLVHEKDKQNPELVKLRMKKYREKKKNSKNHKNTTNTTNTTNTITF